MPRRATVKIKQVGPTSWRVSTAALKPRYRICWPTESEAIRDAERIKRQIAGVGLNATELREYDAVAHRLATTDSDCRGKSLTFIVEWAIANYREAAVGKTLSEYAADYIKRKEAKLEKKSMAGFVGYLKAFNADFGHLEPTVVTEDMIERHLAENTSRYHRDRALRAWFRWMSGKATKSRKGKGLAMLAHPPLSRDPFDYVESTQYVKQNRTEILQINEVRAVLLKAKEVDYGVLAWFVWGMQAGTRPEAESRPFWELEEHGWSQIDSRRGIIGVTDELEKTATRNRDIAIQPCLAQWLAWFKAQNIKPTYSRRKIRAILNEVAPHRKHQDILRKTWISNACKILPESEVAWQGATSVAMIKKYYRRLVNDEEAAEFWKITPASLGLL